MTQTVLGGSENKHAEKVALHLFWTDKYSPVKVSDLVGNKDSFKKIFEWVKNWKKGGLILAGPSGVGKTCSVYAVARELGLEVLEMNASDLRTKDEISQRIGSASMQRSLVAKGKVILVDEIDGVYGTVDRGGVPELLRILETTRYPIVFTANDLERDNLKDLKKECSRIVLEQPGIKEAADMLLGIAKKEGLRVEEGVLEEIARRSGCDLRTSIINLESVSGGRVVTRESLLGIAPKDLRSDIEKVLSLIFRTKNSALIRQALFELDMEPEELMQWVSENIAREYDTPAEVARAYDLLSRADMFSERIIHRQAWSLLKYVSDLSSVGVSSAGESKKNRDFLFPQVIAKMGRTKFMRASRDEKAKIIAEATHCSKARAREQLPYLEGLL